MTRMLLLWTVYVLQFVCFVRATGFYSIVGPGTIRSNFKYNVVVSLHETDGPTLIGVGITGPSYNETKTVEVQPRSTVNVEFDTPKLESGDYFLQAASLSGVAVENKTRLFYKDYVPFNLIQTDKPTYKPGDLVQFRIVFLDHNTNPTKDERPISISIVDCNHNTLAQWNNVELTKGVYTGDYQLSDQPSLGSWMINVKWGDGATSAQWFTVGEYVLPPLWVTIDVAHNILRSDAVIRGTVRSKYSYGMPVKGKATIRIYHETPDRHIIGEKTIDVEGKGYFEFDLVNDSSLKHDESIQYLRIETVMKDELTGIDKKLFASVRLHNTRYWMFHINTPLSFFPDTPIKFEVFVYNFDNSPVRDQQNKVKLLLVPCKQQREPSLEFESYLNEYGNVATFEFIFPETNCSSWQVESQFMDAKRSSIIYRALKPDYIVNIDVITENPRLHEEVEFKVESIDFITYFVYTIVGRGNIQVANRVDVPKGRKSHVIKFIPSFEMIPQAKIYVHYVSNGNLRFAEAIINIRGSFPNSIEITAPLQSKPGEEITLSIKTDPGSYVGLLGVDQRVPWLALEPKNDFEENDIFEGLKSFDTNTPLNFNKIDPYPGEKSGLVTLTNADYPYNNANKVPPKPALAGYPGPLLVRPQRTREKLPDVWIFANNDVGNADGFTLTKKIPDTITSWVITGFSVNPKSGFALTKQPIKIKAFQPFFLSLQLPYSIKQGEVIAIPVNVLNYMEKSLAVEVTMENTDGEYEFTEATNEVLENPIHEVKRVKRVIVPPDSGKSVSFMIRPKKVGQIALEITAISPLAGDALKTYLKVEPEGLTQFANSAKFINLNEKPEFKDTFTIEIPEDAVPDSEYIEFSVVSDLLGSTIQNLEPLLRMPQGSGEQNMANFLTNVLVLKYLGTVKQNMPHLFEKAKMLLKICYQRELTYKHDDGSYSAFGKSDKDGSTWLTAYVVRSLYQAQKIHGMNSEIEAPWEGLGFLASRQTGNGSFVENGKFFGLSYESELGLTSFVLLTFLEVEEFHDYYHLNIVLAIDFILKNAYKSDDQYGLAIAAAALQKANIPEYETILVILENQAKQENEHKWWSNNKEDLSPSPRNNDVEITSYILLTLLENNSAESVSPIIKWLISQRNSNDGFFLTLNTVVGLEALIKFSEKTGFGNGEMKIDFIADGDTENRGKFEINKDNAFVLQTHVLPKSTRIVSFTAKGNGSSIVQLSYRYNLAQEETKASYSIESHVKRDTPPTQLILDLCAKYAPLETTKKQKDLSLPVMEVALPSGYTAEERSLSEIEAIERVKRAEIKNADSIVVIYFNGLQSKNVTCVPIEASRTHAVAKQKPAAVSIYDYFDANNRATMFYEVNSSLCDICEGDDCGTGCK